MCCDSNRSEYSTELNDNQLTNRYLSLLSQNGDIIVFKCLLLLEKNSSIEILVVLNQFRVH